MHSLFSAIMPYHHFMLPVSEIHTLYVEESGNPNGLPVIVLHGGPGFGSTPATRSFFDPERYRIIQFDQRGCGRSLPHACLEDNNTAALIDDIEKIRTHLNIERWVVFGGSWGSTLSLAYAQTHTERVIALIVRGIFLCTKEEINWFYGPDGAANILPDFYQDFVKPLPPEKRKENFIQGYYELLTHEDEAIRLDAALHWSIWEGRASTLEINHDYISKFSDIHTALSIARIECHYFYHDSFLAPNQLLNNMHKIQHIPGYIVHGRYDVICPVKQAWDIHNNWPKSELHIVLAGHSAFEPQITDHLIYATQSVANEFYKLSEI